MGVHIVLNLPSVWTDTYPEPRHARYRAGDGPVVTQIRNYIASPSPAEPQRGLRPKSCTHVCTKTQAHTNHEIKFRCEVLFGLDRPQRQNKVCLSTLSPVNRGFFMKSCHSEMSISSSLLSPPSWPNADLTSCRLWKHTSQRELNTQRCLTGRSLTYLQTSASCVTRDLLFWQNTKAPNKASENG